MSCINRNQILRHRLSITDEINNTVLPEIFNSVIVPVYCACMIAAQGIFSGIHTGILKMQYQVRQNTEFIIQGCLNLCFMQIQKDSESDD